MFWSRNSQSYRTLFNKSSEFLVNWNWAVYCASLKGKFISALTKFAEPYRVSCSWVQILFQSGTLTMWDLMVQKFRLEIRELDCPSGLPYNLTIPLGFHRYKYVQQLAHFPHLWILILICVISSTNWLINHFDISVEMWMLFSPPL